MSGCIMYPIQLERRLLFTLMKEIHSKMTKMFNFIEKKRIFNFLDDKKIMNSESVRYYVVNIGADFLVNILIYKIKILPPFVSSTLKSLADGTL